MSKYFENIPICEYRFGDNEDAVLFPNISSYVDVLDSTKNAAAFYSKENIQDYDRPDTLSYRLYGTVEYYWTFYYMNDGLRRSGWPIAYNELLDLAKDYWPHQTARTAVDISSKLLIGQQVHGSASNPDNPVTGIVVSRNLDLGQVIIKSTSDLKFPEMDTLSYVDSETEDVVNVYAFSIRDQHISPHHYEDLEGNMIDIDPLVQGPITASIIVPVSNYDTLQRKNDSLKIINIIKKDSIGQVVGQWKTYMKNRGRV